MTPAIRALASVPADTPPTDDQWHAVARELFLKLPMVRAFDDDYETTISFFREIYDRGQARGRAVL